MNLFREVRARLVVGPSVSSALTTSKNGVRYEIAIKSNRSEIKSFKNQ